MKIMKDGVDSRAYTPPVMDSHSDSVRVADRHAPELYTSHRECQPQLVGITVGATFILEWLSVATTRQCPRAVDQSRINTITKVKAVILLISCIRHPTFLEESTSND